MNTETNAQESQFTGQATYCPEDNKLRLYIGRVPREEYLALKAEGWTALHKQREAGKGDFVATWTPKRRNTALRYAGIIEDEDAGPEERAADRAERFSGYCDKRTEEATGHADKYDSGPQVHGFQSYARAVKSADRHDRIAGRAVDAWEKAEYWQRRTAGVIAHRLYLSSPAVRMGRIKEIEADIRRCEKSREEYETERALWVECSQMEPGEEQDKRALELAGMERGHYNHRHPRPETVSNGHIDKEGSSLYTLMGMVERGYGSSDITGAEACSMYLAKFGPLRGEGDWLTHYRLRLAYETQMLEAQGGRAAFVEMEIGGWIGKHQIHKVNKSPATGRVVSVELRIWSETNQYGRPWSDGKGARFTGSLTNVERLPADSYRAPTAEEKAAFMAAKKAEKATTPKVPTIPLINPTDEDAQRLQDAINERTKDAQDAADMRRYGRVYSEFKPKTVTRITQAQYSAASKGSYARAETRGLSRNMELADRQTNMYSKHEQERKVRIGPPVCQIRITGYDPVSIIILTDKPQKAFPVAVWQSAPSAELVEA